MTITMQDEMQVTQALQSAAAVVAQYRGTDVSHAAIQMLDTLAASYVMDLMTCTPERLSHYQAAIKQCIALRQVFEGLEFSDPRI